MIYFVAAASDIGISEALGNMVVGLGVVFLALYFLCGIISLFKFIGKGGGKAQEAPAKPAVKAAPAAPAVAAPKEEAIDGAVIAAILAAVAQKCGPNARVTSIEKAK